MGLGLEKENFSIAWNVNTPQKKKKLFSLLTTLT